MNALPSTEAPAARRRFHWNPSADDGGLRFLVRRGDLRRTRLSVDPALWQGGEPLAPGQVRLRVLRFGLDAAATAGAAPAAWPLFPSDDALWALPPVWGLAEVCESRVPQVAVGRTLTGLLPASTYVVLQPEAVRRMMPADTGVAHALRAHEAAEATWRVCEQQGALALERAYLARLEGQPGRGPGPVFRW